MRWLFFFVAVSASGDCVNQTLYRTPDDYITQAVIDGGALYVSLLLARDIQRISLSTGESSVVFVGLPGLWHVQHGYIATPATIGRPADQVKSIEVSNGYVYWVESDGVLRRMLIGGGGTEALAALDILFPQYTIFEDRVLFINGGKLFWKPLAGGETVLVNLPYTDVGSIGTVSPDAILVTVYSHPSSYERRADVIRTSWDGRSVEALYQATASTYHNSLSVVALAAGATTYIVSYEGLQLLTSLIVLRDGIATTRYTITGPIAVLAVTEEAITIAEWGLGTGTHYVVQLCAAQQRRRACCFSLLPNAVSHTARYWPYAGPRAEAPRSFPTCTAARQPHRVL